MKFKQSYKPFIPPAINFFIREQYWAITEAVHVLVGWPKNNLFPVSLLPEDIKQHRSFFYLPCPNTPFDPRIFGKQFYKLFLLMKKSIENGELTARFGFNNEAISYLVCPEEVILWVLNQGLSLPLDLQSAANVHQLEIQTTRDSVRTAVQRKIVAQCILSKKLDINVSEICRDDLMLRLGALDKTADQGLKVIKRAIGKLFTNPGQPGRVPHSPLNRPKRLYVPKAISEVMQCDLDGTHRYHFSYLKRTIETAARAIISDELRDENSIEGYCLEVLQNSVVQLYLEKSSNLIMQFVRQIIHNVIGEYLPLRLLCEKIQILASKGLDIEWPLKYGNCELKPRVGKIGLF